MAAPAIGVDFVHDAPAARDRINGWVESQTNSKIKDLIPSGGINAETVLVLTNAIYFKGAWQFPFQEKATTSQPFHVSTDKNADVQMMKSDSGSSFEYMETDDFQALSLPYKAASPREGRGLPSFR